MDTYCTSCGARYPLGDAHACAKKSTRPAASALEAVEKADVVPSPLSLDTPKRGRPRIHPDRKSYRAKWQRDKRAADAAKAKGETK